MFGGFENFFKLSTSFGLSGDWISVKDLAKAAENGLNLNLNRCSRLTLLFFSIAVKSWKGKFGSINTMDLQPDLNENSATV